MALMALLTACGGGNLGTEANNSPMTVTAASMVSGGANPAPDCQPDNCSEPRSVDGLAEEYRAAALQRQAQEASQPPLTDALPAELAQGQ
jgi:hypothetical protein